MWMVLGPAAVFYLVKMVVGLLSALKARSVPAAEYYNTMLQWGIMIIIFIPICTGLVIFGWYAFKGEFSNDQGPD
jgi:purine-cytosine permease-like protein